ncbi:unnamed protein product, partial [Bubo scandiacus]
GWGGVGGWPRAVGGGAAALPLPERARRPALPSHALARAPSHPARRRRACAS